MKLSDMFPSNYLKKEDVQTPNVRTIAGVGQEELKGDEGVEVKNILYFREDGMKPMVLNKVNAFTIAELYGDDSDAWAGKPIEVYSDLSIMMAGRRVGGIRVRRPPQGAGAAPAPAAAPYGDEMDGPAWEAWVKNGDDRFREAFGAGALTAEAQRLARLRGWPDDLVRWAPHAIAEGVAHVRQFVKETKAKLSAAGPNGGPAAPAAAPNGRPAGPAAAPPGRIGPLKISALARELERIGDTWAGLKVQMGPQWPGVNLPADLTDAQFDAAMAEMRTMPAAAAAKAGVA